MSSRVHELPPADLPPAAEAPEPVAAAEPAVAPAAAPTSPRRLLAPHRDRLLRTAGARPPARSRRGGHARRAPDRAARSADRVLRRARGRVRGRVLALPRPLPHPQPAAAAQAQGEQADHDRDRRGVHAHDHDQRLHGDAGHVPVHALPALRLPDPGVLAGRGQEDQAGAAVHPAAVHRGRGVRLLRRRALRRALPLLLGLGRGQPAAARAQHLPVRDDDDVRHGHHLRDARGGLGADARCTCCPRAS